MKRALLGKGISLLAVAVATGLPGAARADDPYGLAPGQLAGANTFATWGGARGLSQSDATSVSHDSPVTRAREMLTRARFLDEAAAIDEKKAAELAGRRWTKAPRKARAIHRSA
jgi:hypothetical protein